MTLADLEDRIAAMRRDWPLAPADGRSRELQELLTDGYAHVMRMEAAKARIERRMGDLSANVHDLEVARELRVLAGELNRNRGSIARLRSSLGELEELRAAV